MADHLDIEDTEANFSGGGLYLTNATAALTNSAIENCRGDQTGGPVFAANTDLILSTSLISNCKASNYLSGYGGGAIRATGTTTLDLFDVTIERSTAFFGGGISLASGTYATLHSLQATNNTVDNVANTAEGGALHIADGAEAHCTDCYFGENGADLGGAVFLASNSSFSDNGSLFEKNTAQDRGGALFLDDPLIASQNSSVFRSNHADHGGAVWLEASAAGASIFDASRFDNNTATNAGGGIGLGASAALSVREATFTGNSSGSGGAIWVNASSGEIDLADSVFDRNTATLEGGAIASDNPQDLTLTRLTFQENASGSRGGAWAHDGLDATCELSTFIANRSSQGGAIAAFGTSVTLSLINNSLVEKRGVHRGSTSLA